MSENVQVIQVNTTEYISLEERSTFWTYSICFSYLRPSLCSSQGGRRLKETSWQLNQLKGISTTVPKACHWLSMRSDVKKYTLLVLDRGGGKRWQMHFTMFLPVFNQWTQLITAEWMVSALLVMASTSSLLELMIVCDYGIVLLGKTHW